MALGTGYLPSGALGNQLSYITRRAILPKAVVQIWNASPLVCALLANAEKEAGGVDSITANVQYAQLTQPQWTGFQGNFNSAQIVAGVQPAAWTFCAMVCPIPVLLTELLIQEKQKIQNLLSLRFNDAGNAIRDALGQALFNNTTNTSQILGLPAAIDDGTVVASYAGINRSTNTWWQSKRYNAGSVNPTRALILQYLLGVTKQQGEKPMFGVVNAGTWGLLAQDFLGLERYIPNEGNMGKYLSAFSAVEVAGVPIYMDPYCPEGTLYLINTNYLTMRVHEQADFEFEDFVPMTPVNQLSYVGVIYMLLALINTKPKANGQVFGLNSLSI
jgi:hypothetical protein